MAYAIGSKNNKKPSKKPGKKSDYSPKPDLEAIKRRMSTQDAPARQTSKSEPEAFKPKGVEPPTFIPVIIDSSHDVVGKNYREWRRHLIQDKPLKSIPVERKYVLDPEIASTIYRLAGETVRDSVDSGSWNDQPQFKDMLSGVADKAMSCYTLNSNQLFPFLRAAVQILQEEPSAGVQDLFDEMKALDEADESMSSDRVQHWIRFLTCEVAAASFSGTQSYLYSTLECEWDFLSDCKGHAPSRLELLELAYKFGTTKCTEANFVQKCLNDLAKLLGSIDPIDWLWVESVENFRSRAWALVENERRKFDGVLETEGGVAPTDEPSELKELRQQTRAWLKENPVKPAQATIATSPPSRPETFGETALRLYYAAKPVLPDITPTVEVASTSTDPLVLAACAKSTDVNVLMAVLNNPKSSFETIEQVVQNDLVAQLIVNQSEGR